MSPGEKPRSLVWTVCAFRKPSMTEDEFHHYMTNVHAPLVRDALVRHGITRYSMSHFDSASKALLAQVMDPQFVNDSGYDMVTQIRFPDIQCFINFKNDPFYKDRIMADHDRFTDPERVFLSVGWVEDHVVDGVVA
ncbi:hypothetical protein LLEC1_04193 [Akanthomyces lecanii]|uniref:EthD domain-containing protein n=1 Tax=Cordyceps confragosa TaxID=2714763 RepID=A0A179IKC8_CORDF|nr:hypothetical protein LLEC1_04193 [Akanthomyces lecanii]